MDLVGETKTQGENHIIEISFSVGSRVFLKKAHGKKIGDIFLVKKTTEFEVLSPVF